MEMREIRENDLPVLAKMNAEIFGDTEGKGLPLAVFLEAWKQRVAKACLAAEENGEIVGAIMAEEKMTFYKNSSYITSFFVKNEWQGKGVGKMLIEAALAALKKEGYENVSLTVALDNQKAISLYEKEGFEPFRMVYLKKL
jgi:ribosomal protein S18 acetylase RimI-like enzyme